jgi:hypothetical protein
VLRASRLGFVFAAGFDDGRRLLRERLKALTVSAEVFVHLLDGSLPFAFGEGMFGGASDEFRDAATAIGKKLLESAGQPPDLAAARSLGYGNRGLLLVFPFNTPAQTLTLLWQDSCSEALEWRALFPRRRKS